VRQTTASILDQLSRLNIGVIPRNADTNFSLAITRLQSVITAHWYLKVHENITHAR
jgi:hypothetical protein